jgi:hypothetical protein
MKKLLLSLFAIVTLSLSSFGQAPEGFKYQAVVRDASSLILANQALGMQLMIRQGSVGGTPVYTETFAPTTNGYGLVNLEIGTGTTSDDFTLIDWANGPYFMETAADITGGTSYAVIGTSQLMSVPYALHAKTSGNGAGPTGPQGPAGNDGATGPQGIQGNVGPAGPAGSSDYADFYALMPGDNTAIVDFDNDVEFPQNGPNSATGITRVSATTFNLADVGTYEVHFTVSVDEPCQLQLRLNGMGLSSTVVGRATGNSQITGNFLIQTSVPNSFLSVMNTGFPFTITPIAGGFNPVSAHLVIKKM